MTNAKSTRAERRGVRPVDSIYVHIGWRLRERRMRAGLTMLSLATAVGISYQQVQKYEKARDRLPAGHLYAFAQVLGCSPNFFFVGFDEGLIEQPDIDPGFPITREAQDLFKAYSSLDAASRKAVLRLLRLTRDVDGRRGSAR